MVLMLESSSFQIIMYFGMISILSLIFLKETKKGSQKEISFKNIVLEYRLLLKDFKFLLASSVTNLLYGNFLVFLTYTPFLYIKVFGMTASQYSLHQGTAVIAFSLANFVLSRFSESINIKSIKIGLFCCLFGSSAIYFVNSPYLITFFICLVTTGAAMTFPTIMAYSIGSVSYNLKGAASSFSIGTRYVISGFIIYIVSSGYNGTNTRLSMFMSTISMVIFAITLYLFKKKFFTLKEMS